MAATCATKQKGLNACFCTGEEREGGGEKPSIFSSPSPFPKKIGVGNKPSEWQPHISCQRALPEGEGEGASEHLSAIGGSMGRARAPALRPAEQTNKHTHTHTKSWENGWRETRRFLPALFHPSRDAGERKNPARSPPPLLKSCVSLLGTKHLSSPLPPSHNHPLDFPSLSLSLSLHCPALLFPYLRQNSLPLYIACYPRRRRERELLPFPPLPSSPSSSLKKKNSVRRKKGRKKERERESKQGKRRGRGATE